MTPAEITAAAKGWGRAERTRLVTVARAFGSDLSEREARQIIEGTPQSAPDHKTQEEKLKKMAKESFGEEID